MCTSFKISQDNVSFDSGFSYFILLFVWGFLQPADFHFCQGLLSRKVSGGVSLLSSQPLTCNIACASVVAWLPNAWYLPNWNTQECKYHYHTLYHRIQVFCTTWAKIFFYPIKHKSWQLDQFCCFCRTLACIYDFSLRIKVSTRLQQSSHKILTKEVIFSQLNTIRLSSLPKQPRFS